MLSIKHFVTKDGRVLIYFPQFVQFTSLLSLLNDLLTALFKLCLQNFNLLAKSYTLNPRLIVLKHLCIDLLQVVSLLANLSLQALSLQQFSLHWLSTYGAIDAYRDPKLIRLKGLSKLFSVFSKLFLDVLIITNFILIARFFI